jgi:ATPase family AAA domain-containing protein 2
LSDALENVKEAIQRVLPLEKKLSALEEAEFEDDGGEEGALDREMLSQGMDLFLLLLLLDSFSFFLSSEQ